MPNLVYDAENKHLFAQALSHAMKTKKISSYKATVLSGVNPTQVRKLAAGEAAPSFMTAAKLAKGLGFSLDELAAQLPEHNYDPVKMELLKKITAMEDSVASMGDE